ncbi:MAG: hypothetical protein ABSD46_02140 [Bacteroidota bacterium]
MSNNIASLSESTFRSNIRHTGLPSCNIDIRTLKKLFGKLNECCREAATIELSKLRQGTMTTEQYEKFKNDVAESYKINVEILGKKGEYFSSTSESLLDENVLPSQLVRLTFNSEFLFKTAFNAVPMNSVKIIIDFNKATVLDFSSNPSHPTSNDSVIDVLGQTESWVDGVYKAVNDILKECSTHRTWLHRRGIYDLFLWLFIIPLSFWNLHKLVLGFPTFFNAISGVIQVFVSIYFLLLIILLYRAFFSYARWVFPYIELSSTSKTTSTRHRIFFTGLTLTLTYGLLKDLIKRIIEIIF